MPMSPLGVNSAPRPESSTLIRKLDGYKLETEFRDGYVVHRTYKWNLSTRLWEESVWKQEKRIGDGTFGTVWLQKEQHGQLRAVKILPRESSLGTGSFQELLSLVRLKNYDHLFVKFFGWYENRDCTFLAMEYIENGDLSKFLLENPLKVKEDAKEIARQISEGLEALHKEGICHRDLKPQNILIASLDPVWVKITDFGLSKSIKNTTARTLCGTQGYLAPELLGSLPRRYRTREFLAYALDIWSLGSLVHELLTSRTPFAVDVEYDSETEAQPESRVDRTFLYEYCDGRVEFPIEILQNAKVSEEGIAFVRRLLVPNPKDRPSATSILQDPWLKGYTSSWLENLKTEFSCLGLDLDFGGEENKFMRQVGNADIMRFLPSLSKKQVRSLLLEAATKCYHSVISMVLKSPSRKPIGCLTRGKLFQLSTEAKQLDTIKLLLHHGFDIGALVDGRTVLQWAAKAGHTDTVILLIKRKVKVITGTNYQESFQLAIESGHSGLVKALLGKEIDIRAKLGFNGYRALQTAVEGGHTDIVKILLEHKVDVNATTRARRCRTALQMAVEGGHIDIVKLLVENGADVNAKTRVKGSRIALQAAVEGEHTEIVELLLENKADMNVTTGVKGGQTVLQAAVEGGHTEIVRLLLENKADVNATAGAMGGQTILQAAVEGGHTEIVKLLLENKTDVNATTLQVAVKSGNIEIVKLLLEKKADMNSTTTNGCKLLRAAIVGRHIGIVKLLLENKVDANTTKAKTRAVLQAAAEGKHPDTVWWLLSSEIEKLLGLSPYSHSLAPLELLCEIWGVTWGATTTNGIGNEVKKLESEDNTNTAETDSPYSWIYLPEPGFESPDIDLRKLSPEDQDRGSKNDFVTISKYTSPIPPAKTRQPHRGR